MSKVIYLGSLPSHSPEYGIKYQNIALRLTRLNYKEKAIVIGSIYIFIMKYKNDGHDEYQVRFDRGYKNKSFRYLNDALKYANETEDNGEEFPDESPPPFTIITRWA